MISDSSLDAPPRVTCPSKVARIMSATTTAPMKQLVEVPTAQTFIKYRTVLILLSEIVLIAVSYYGSFLLRLDAGLSPAQHDLFMNTLLLVVLVKLIVFHRFGLLRGWWRYVGMNDLANIGMASFVSSTFIFLLIEFLIHFQGYPRSVIPIDMFLSVMLV